MRPTRAITASSGPRRSSRSGRSPTSSKRAPPCCAISARRSRHSTRFILQGIDTLALRIDRHVANAAAVAAYLVKRPEVARVIHPSQQSGVQRQRADKYLGGKYGGLVGFELAGGREAGR